MTTTETQAGAGELCGHASGEVYHIVDQFDKPRAACNAHIVLKALRHPEAVGPDLRCQRSGCRQRWPK